MQFLDLPWWQQVSRGLMTWLSEFIYSIMGFFYELFNIVTETNILSSKDVQPIYQRMTMILTIVMVFYITFQFVKYVVQPDSMTDKEKGAGNIVYKMVIVIVLIAFVPKIFEMAYKVQNVIINKSVIPKVILGPQASIDEENLGPSFAASVFSMFYYVEAENANKYCYDGVTCHEIVANNLSDLQKGEKLKSLSFGINETDDSDKPLITFEFHGILPVAVGAVIVWILMLYCIDVGTRWAQLLYLQLIAPIPILGYMSPKKDGIFQKWAKQCFTTYLDLFLRVAIINIILLLCHTLIQSKITGGIVELSSKANTVCSLIGDRVQEIEIIGGTILGVSSRNDIAIGRKDITENIEILGGSILVDGKKGKYAVPPKAGDTKVYLTQIQLQNVSEEVQVTSLITSDNLTYGIKDMYTANEGKLYLYLPTGEREITIKAGNKDYIGNVKTGDEDSTEIVILNER